MAIPTRGRRRAVRRLLWRDYLANRSGSSATEFAIILPVFLLLLLGIIQIGIIFNQYIELANGTAAGGRTLASARGSTSAYTDTLTAIHGAAPNLNSFATPITGQTLTVVVAGTTCTSGNQAGACASAFASGASAVITVTYPCSIALLWFSISGCTLGTSDTEYIQ